MTKLLRWEVILLLTQGVTSKTGRRVLFGLLVCLNVGAQVAILAAVAGGGFTVWTSLASGVFLVWVLGMAGPWRPPEVDVRWWLGFGEVDANGLSGFGLPPGEVVRWDAVRRITLTHAERVGRYQMIAHRTQPTWARVETADHTMWVPRPAFPACGWRAAQRPRTASEEEALLPPPDRAWHTMYGGMALLFGSASVSSVMIGVNCNRLEAVLAPFLLLMVGIGMGPELVWLRWALLGCAMQFAVLAGIATEGWEPTAFLSVPLVVGCAAIGYAERVRARRLYG